MSQESQAQKELFKLFSKNMPTDNNYFIARALYDQVASIGSEADGVTIEDTVISANGLNVPCKWFKPASTKDSKHVILFMHGGGFTIGSANGHRKLAAHLAKEANCPSLSVDYRLAPENKYPAAHEDCLAAYQSLLDNGYKPSQVIVAGDSCGGHLATSIPLLCIKKGVPVPALSVSLSPWYDLSTQDGGSMEYNSQKDVLQDKAGVYELVNRYIIGTDTSLTDPIVSPVFAPEDQIKQLPPHWISIGGDDMLRDHGERMVEKLQKAGVEVVSETHEDQQHVMEFLAGRAPEAKESLRKIGQWIRNKMEN